MTAPALPPALLAALETYAEAAGKCAQFDGELGTRDMEDEARGEVERAIAAELARLRNGLAIAESFVRTSTAEIAAAYDAGRDAATLEPSEVEALHAARALLKEIEWSGNAWGECCPACRRFADGHAPGCRLAALLQGHEVKP